MTLNDFEDPTELSRCVRSDCERYRLDKDTPLCVKHMREQEQSAAGYVEPELEAKVAKVRTEDDDHPGMVKVYDKDTGEPSWVPAPPKLYVGPDPDVNGQPDPIQAGAAGIHRAFADVGMPPASDLAARLDQLEREVTNDDGTTASVLDVDRWAEIVQRRTELLELTYRKLGEAREADTRTRCMSILSALRQLLHEELRGADW